MRPSVPGEGTGVQFELGVFSRTAQAKIETSSINDSAAVNARRKGQGGIALDSFSRMAHASGGELHRL
jgi:hypothetical protein